MSVTMPSMAPFRQARDPVVRAAGVQQERVDADRIDRRHVELAVGADEAVVSSVADVVEEVCFGRENGPSSAVVRLSWTVTSNGRSSRVPYTSSTSCRSSSIRASFWTTRIVRPRRSYRGRSGFERRFS